jgi:hypothetical protein
LSFRSLSEAFRISTAFAGFDLKTSTKLYTRLARLCL